MEFGNFLKSAIPKKAYEIAYAAFRISESLPYKVAYQKPLEEHALALLNAAIAGDRSKLEHSSMGLHTFVRFGLDVGLIHPSDSEVFIAELGKFNAAIDSIELGNNPANELPNLGIGKVFTSLEGKTQKFKEKETKAVVAPLDSSSFKERERIILEKIRQFGSLSGNKSGCRLKDILEILPNSSERTIRYDLQTLVEQGVLERVGPGGPGTFYRPGEIAPARFIPSGEPPIMTPAP